MEKERLILKLSYRLYGEKKGSDMVAEIQISLAAARVNAGMTQEDIARKMNLAKQTIVNWEKGRVVPKSAQFEMYCRICNMPTDCINLPRMLTKS